MISKLLDMIEKKVNKQKENNMVVGLGDIGKLLGPALGQAMPDPLSSIGNSYKQWGPIQQANASGVNLSGVSVLGSAIGGVTTQGTPLQYCLPPAIGITITIAFTDANGISMAIAVDQAYIGIMCQISNVHQMKRNVGVNVGSYYPPPIKNDGPKQKIFSMQEILEGDFSYDEMKLAETIIEELESGREARQQEDICNLA